MKRADLFVPEGRSADELKRAAMLILKRLKAGASRSQKVPLSTEEDEALSKLADAFRIPKKSVLLVVDAILNAKGREVQTDYDVDRRRIDAWLEEWRKLLPVLRQVETFQLLLHSPEKLTVEAISSTVPVFYEVEDGEIRFYPDPVDLPYYPVMRALKEVVPFMEFVGFLSEEEARFVLENEPLSEEERILLKLFIENPRRKAGEIVRYAGSASPFSWEYALLRRTDKLPDVPSSEPLAISSPADQRTTMLHWASLMTDKKEVPAWAYHSAPGLYKLTFGEHLPYNPFCVRGEEVVPLIMFAMTEEPLEAVDYSWAKENRDFLSAVAPLEILRDVYGNELFVLPSGLMLKSRRFRREGTLVPFLTEVVFRWLNGRGPYAHLHPEFNAPTPYVAWDEEPAVSVDNPVGVAYAVGMDPKVKRAWYQAWKRSTS